MKRIVLLLIVISFVSGTAAFILLSPNAKEQTAEPAINNADSAPEISNLVFCDLVGAPEKYHGRVVRFTAGLTRGLEGSWFSDPKCGIDNAALAFSGNKEVWQTIDRRRLQSEKAGSKNETDSENHIELTVVGKFINVRQNEGGLMTPFQFEILRVE